MYPRASIASFPRSVQSTPNPLALGPYCLIHFALIIKSSASERYSSGVLDSFAINDGKRFQRHFLTAAAADGLTFCFPVVRMFLAADQQRACWRVHARGNEFFFRTISDTRTA